MSRDEGSTLRVVAEEALAQLEAVAQTTPLSQLFHRVWSVLPQDQELVDVSPDDRVGDAFAKMAEHDFSQLPVRAGDEVLGVFSYRSFAVRAADQLKLMPRTGLADMPVDGFVDKPIFVTQYDELPELFDLLDTEPAVFVGDERKLVGILTTVDVLRWLHNLAEPFVRLGEIERSLREIVTRKLSSEQIAECAEHSLKQHYDQLDKPTPKAVEEMSFEELRLIVIDGRNWSLLEPALGRSREMAKSKLTPLPQLRNDVFHFKRDLEEADLDAIRTAREWLLNRLRMMNEGRSK